jgi:DNA-binding NarL/FixJ family response regulator
VDDNPAIRKIICELFTREGDFEVCGQAENGREAIEKAQLLRPALIVTDLSMPLMNGLEEARILKKLMPVVPIIIHSIHVDRFVEREALAAGASAVVSKSDDVAVLIGKARELLDEIAAQTICFPSPGIPAYPASKSPKSCRHQK